MYLGLMVQSRVFFWSWNVYIYWESQLSSEATLPVLTRETYDPLLNNCWDLHRLRAFRSMCKLDLSHSQLDELPEAIGFLPSLTHLFLNDNYLSSLQPEIIRRLVNLQDLDLRNNQLKDFSSVITELSCLRRLSVQGNPLKDDETRKLMKLANNERWIDIAGECKIL